MKMWLKIILIWMACSVVVGAEEVVELVNGDRISGEVIKVESGTVYLRSELLGEIQLPASAVKSCLAALKTPPFAPAMEGTEDSVLVVVLPAEEPKEEPHKFDLRKALHVPENVKGDIKISAYRREREFLEDYIDIAPTLTWDNDTHSWEWRLHYRYRRDNNTEDGQWVERDDRMTAEQKYRYNFDKTIFAQSRTYWENDRVKNIEPRFIQSGGLGLYVLNNDTLQLDFAPGVGYEYVDNTGTVESKLMPTFDQNFKWVINSHFSYKERFSWLGLEDEYQYDFVNELEAKLNDHFAVVLEHRLDYDQQVVDDGVTDSRDERTTASLRLSF
ncbi:DUF481 domain-containing protein [Verrucomicrobiota bacterium]